MEPEKTNGNAVTLFVKYFSAAFCLFALLYSSNILARWGVFFPGSQYNAIFMAGILTVLFLTIPAKKGAPKNSPRWYDFLLIAGALAGCLYIAVHALDILWAMSITASPFEAVLGYLFLAVICEAVRRTMGWAMVCIALVFIAYVKFGHLIPGSFGLPEYSWSRIIADLYLSQQGFFGSLTTLATTLIITFVAFGALFSKAGGGDFFMNFAMAVTGSTRGGPAKSAVVGSGLFGMISGSGVANVVVTGCVTIPMMKRTGYSAVFAGAVESVASPGGQIMPPVMGTIAFVMAALLNVTYTKVALAAAIPACLYYIALYFQVDFRAAASGLHGLPRSELPSLKKTFKEAWELSIPFIILVVLMFVMKMPVATSAVYTVASVIVVSWFRKGRRITLGRLVDALEEAWRDTLGIAALIGVAGVILAALSVTGIGPRISGALVTLSGGHMFPLALMAALVVFISGMGVSALLSYVVLAALIPPALARYGVPPMASHFFLVYMGVSMMYTPPYCPAAFVASTIAKANYFRIGLQAMRLGIAGLVVPFIFIYKPELLLIGTPIKIILATLVAIIGLYAVSAGLEGYQFAKMGWVQRFLFLLAGIVTLFPDPYTDVIGIAMVLVLTLWQLQLRKKAAAVPSPDLEIPTLCDLPEKISLSELPDKNMEL